MKKKLMGLGVAILMVLSFVGCSSSAEEEKSAVEMIKGVKSVEPYISNGSEYITEMRIQSEIREKLREFIRKNL